MKTVPLGDGAALVSTRDERAAARLSAAIRAASPSWLIDLVPAYRSVGVYFDRRATNFAEVARWIRSIRVGRSRELPGRSFRIPCCYELGPDLESAARQTGLSADEVVRRHSTTVYTVFAIGFCPGFPYLGYLPDELSGIPRLASPRLRVEPGSVGLTGRQTGIYPLPRPGGWPIIGRTPSLIVDLPGGFFALAPGDRVRFQSIDTSSFRAMWGQRLAPTSDV
jgi:inhibitor of KinA